MLKGQVCCWLEQNGKGNQSVISHNENAIVLPPLPGPVVATADEDGILPACVRERAGVNGTAGDVIKGGSGARESTESSRQRRGSRDDFGFRLLQGRWGKKRKHRDSRIRPTELKSGSAKLLRQSSTECMFTLLF